jgi:hypothetical protein
MNSELKSKILRAKRKGAFARGLLIYLPLGICTMGLGGWLSGEGLLSRKVSLGISLLLLPLILALLLLRRKILRLPLSPENAEVLDHLLGIPGNEGAFTRFLKRLGSPARDRFYPLLLLTASFSLGLNLTPYLGILLKPLLGSPSIIRLERSKTLVEIRSLTVVDPVTGKSVHYSGHDGFLRVEEGARILGVVHPTLPVSRLWIRFSSGTRLPLAQESSGEFSFSFLATASAEYIFQGERDGILWEEGSSRHLFVNPDLPPEIEWVTTPPSLLKNEPALSFSFRARDDRGLKAISLEAEGVTTVSIPLPFPEGATNTGILTSLVLEKDLPPGGTITLTLLAYDNDRFPEPKVSRSTPFTLQRLSPLDQHEEFLKRLKELRKGGVLLLGDLWEKPETPPPTLQEEATRLSFSARELSAKSRQLPFSAPGTPQKLLAISLVWEKTAGLNPWDRTRALKNAEEAVWQTDRLISQEVSARVEMRSKRIEELLRSLEKAIAQGDLKTAERIFEEISKERRELERELREHMEEAPPELVQEEGLRRELQGKRDLYEELIQALREGDRQRIEEILKKLKEEISAQKRLLDALRTPLLSSFPQDGEISRAWSQLLSLKGKEEEILRNLNQLNPSSPNSSRRFEELARRQGEWLRELKGFREGIEGKKEWGEVESALREAERRGEEGLEHLKGKEQEKGSSTLEGGLQALREAMEALRRLAEEKLKAQKGLSAEREGVEGENPIGSLRSPLGVEPHPRTSLREEALKGFRKGIPEFGAEYNRRYLDRLLH